MTDLLQGEKKKPFEERFFSSPPAPPHLFPNLLIIFDIFFFLLCAAVYIFAQTMIRPRCKKCGKRMLKKYIFTGYGGENQLYFHCPDCRIYSDTNIYFD